MKVTSVDETYERGRRCCHTFSFNLFFPVQQTTSGIGHRVIKKYGSFFGLSANTLDARNDDDSNNGPE